jgi:ABC-type glycerol-3-phosphate transport system substrate-binding protein
MSVDTLAMYVNKDLLNTAGVSTVPQDWLSFQNAVKRLTRQTPQGEIQQAGAAIGTGLNVERSPDILALLMMQNGADMSAEDGSPTFNVLPTRLEGILEEPPAYQAVRFYTDFGNPGKEVYTWNNQQPNSLDAFVQGKAAFFFGYAYHMPIIKARGPKINLGISKVPQIEGNPVVNFANYWAWGVSKKTKNPDLSWALLNFMRKPEENTKFLAIAKRPAALKSQIDAQLEDPDVNVFAAQVLTAKSWYRGNNARTADDALVSLIEAALVTDQEQLPQLVNLAVQKVAQTIGYNGF